MAFSAFILAFAVGWLSGPPDVLGRVTLQATSPNDESQTVLRLMRGLGPVAHLDLTFVWDDEGVPQYRTIGAPPSTFQPLSCVEVAPFNDLATNGEVHDVEITPTAQAADVILSLHPAAFSERPFGFIGCVADPLRPGRSTLAVQGVFAVRQEAMPDGVRLRLTPAPIALTAPAPGAATPGDVEPADAPPR